MPCLKVANGWRSLKSSRDVDFAIRLRIAGRKCPAVSEEMILSSILGIVVGLILGLTGAGGGILAVPALIAGMGWSMQQAAPVALIAVAAGAAFGAAEALYRGLVRYKAALLMTCAGVPLTSLGLRAAGLAPQRLLVTLFALGMLFVAYRLWRQIRLGGNGEVEHRKSVAQVNPTTGKLVWTWQTATIIAMIGALTGFMTGLLGVGGGFVIVPMLRRFTALTMQGIVATSLMVVALVSFGGVVTALLRGADMPFEVTFLFALTTVCGMVTGRLLARRLSGRMVQTGFALVLVVVSSGMLAKALFLS